MEFQNQTAVITGGASGIALVTAQKLAKEGANLVLLDVDQKKLEEETARLKQEGCAVLGIVTDVRDYGQVQKAVHQAKEEFGAIDILINCAGGSAGRVFHTERSLDKIPIEVLDWGIDVNFRAPLYLSRAVINTMLEQKRGVIINVGSIMGITGGTDAEYCAAKSGMIGLTKSLALIGAPAGVRCCCVTPGPVLTRPNMAEMYTPLGRAAQPSEIADLILYLCSEKAAFITGANYMIDGGRACGAK